MYNFESCGIAIIAILTVSIDVGCDNFYLILKPSSLSKLTENEPEEVLDGEKNTFDASFAQIIRMSVKKS